MDYSAGRDARSRKGEGMGVARLLLSTCARSQWEATMARGSWDDSNKSGEVISRQTAENEATQCSGGSSR